MQYISFWWSAIYGMECLLDLTNSESTAADGNCWLDSITMVKCHICAKAYKTHYVRNMAATDQMYVTMNDCHNVWPAIRNIIWDNMLVRFHKLRKYSSRWQLLVRCQSQWWNTISSAKTYKTHWHWWGIRNTAGCSCWSDVCHNRLPPMRLWYIPLGSISK